MPIGDSALLSSNIVKDATLKIYPGVPHGLTSTHKEQFNADLLSFRDHRSSAPPAPLEEPQRGEALAAER